MTSSNYLCCGLDQSNPWGDMFGAGATQASIANDGQKQVQEQNWNSPSPIGATNSFNSGYNSAYNSANGNFPQSANGSVASGYGSGYASPDPPASPTRDFETRSYGSHYSPRSVSSDVRTSASHSPRRIGGKPSSALIAGQMLISPSLSSNGSFTSKGSGSRSSIKVMKSQEMMTARQVQTEHRRVLYHEREEIAQKKKGKPAATWKKKKEIMLVTKTESSRKKELTPEDVRDPETVPGMKSKLDVEMEDTAQQRALMMVNSDEFEFNQKAGLAVYTPIQFLSNKRTKSTLLAPLV